LISKSSTKYNKYFIQEDPMDAKIEILGKNMEVTDRIEDYVGKKIEKLDRYLSNMDEVRVDLGFVKSARSAADRQVAQITIRGKGYILRTEERADDIFAAFDTTLDKMQRQIERFKGKKHHGRGDGKSAAEVVEEPVVADDIEQPLIVKRKSFHLVPMDELEAIEQMTLLGHETFFVFYNVETNSINVLYTRRDGSFGLITPEIG
jgi:putative sigma-54 modulation protein